MNANPAMALKAKISREVQKRQQNGVALIALHPEKGIFLGVDENTNLIFQKMADIDPEQLIPTNKLSQSFADSGAYKTDIANCILIQVKETYPDSNMTLAKDVIDFENGSIDLKKIDGLDTLYGHSRAITKGIATIGLLADQFQSATLGHVFPFLRPRTAPYHPLQKPL